MRTAIALLLAGAVMATAPTPARAEPVTELGLAIDVSGSIRNANFLLQKSAYINVLNNPSILPLDGSVAIGVIAFDDDIHPVFTTTVITQSTIGSLISALQTNLLNFGGATAIGDAIDHFTKQLLQNTINSTRQVIDVSTDGDGNSGRNQVSAANAAVAAGIDQVNCLGVGAGANCNFNRGADSFSVTVTSFADFETTLERKIRTEVAPTTVPEPASLAIFGAALTGLFARRFRLKRA